jgi:kynurenine formamidase
VTSGGVPRFDELPVRDGAPPSSSWGVFGADDDLGTLNFLSQDHVRQAAKLVVYGRVFPLNWDVRLPAPAFFQRQPPDHTLITKYNGFVVDDWVDGFFLQGSSQWDGLRHFGDPDYGFYDGVGVDDVVRPGPGRLGIEAWAERGIVGRAVLLDVPRHVARQGHAVDPLDYYPITADLLEEVAAAQRTEIRAGDVLLVRTGWVEAYDALTDEQRGELAAIGRPGSPGLSGAAIPGFLWDRRVAAVAMDNPALEVARPGTGADLELHKALIARLGVPLGELWRLGPLAADCAQDGRYEAFLCSAPMNLPGGAGSPANAIAIK